MKTDYTSTISEVIQYDVAGGAVSKPYIKTEYYSSTQSTFVDFTDLEGRTIELSNENRRYMVYSFMPPSKKISFTLNNFEQLYSTGSGNTKATILKKNLIVRAWSGFELTQSEAQTSQSDDFASTNKFVHTQKSGSTVIYDISSYTGTVDGNLLKNMYNSNTYGATTYEYSGYYLKTFTITDAERKFKQATITTSSADFDFRYRVSPYSDFFGATWSTISSIASGSNTKNFNADLDDDYLQVALLFKKATGAINSISVLKEDNVFLFKQGTFILDDPNYQDTKVVCNGRDYLKKALETEINLPDLTGTLNVATAMTYVLDRCGVPYDTAEWDTTSTTISVDATVAEQLDNISGWQALDFLMDAVNAGDDDWRLKTEETGNLSLKKIPTDVEADYTIHYFYNIESIDKDLDSDKQLQRITVMNKDIVVNPEIELKTYTGTATALHLTYGTTALYVRYTDDNSVIITEDSRSNTAIDFTLSGSTSDIVLYGCTPKNALTVEVFAEAGNSDNIVNNEGSTYKRINPFMSANMCQKFADYLIGFYGDPAKKITLSMVPNPYLELNDNLVIFDLYTYTDDIYGLTSIRESWNEPALKVQLTLEDRGFDLGDFIWDRNGFKSGINDLDYDKGFVWDQNLEIGGSDSNTYLKPIRMQ